MWDSKITDGTPLSSTHAYKTEGGGRILRCGTVKKAKKATRDTLDLELKNAPTHAIVTILLDYGIRHMGKFYIAKYGSLHRFIPKSIGLEFLHNK